MKKEIIIFTDGASKGNPGPGGYGAIIVLPSGKVVELGGGEAHTTNNRMELSAVLFALKEISKNKESIVFYTDSKYLIGGITGWVYGWQKNNWKKKETLPDGQIKESDVLNQDLWKELVKLTAGKKIKWNYVGGHIGVAGNERCDEIADSFATSQKISLYKGPLAKYAVNIHELGHDEEKKKIKSNKSAKAYSYLSLVNGILKIDKTWPECEKRVKGQKGVKYKKAISEIEEKEIIRSWGANE